MYLLFQFYEMVVFASVSLIGWEGCYALPASVCYAAVKMQLTSARGQ